MNDEALSHARIAGRNYEQFSVNGKTDVTDEPFIQNLVDYPSIIGAAFRQTFQDCARSLRKVFHFIPRLAQF